MARKPNEKPAPRAGDSSASPSGEAAPSSQQFLRLMRQQLDQLEQDLTGREQRLARTEQELREAQQRLQADQTDHRARESDLNERLAKAECELKEARAGLQKEQAALAEYRAREGDLRERLVRTESEFGEVRARLQNEQAVLAEHRTREGGLGEQLADTAKRLAAHESSLKDRDQQLQVFAAKNQELRDQLAQLTRQRDEAQKSLTEARKQLEQQVVRVAALEKQVASLKVKASAVARPTGPPPPSELATRQSAGPLVDEAARNLLLSRLSIATIAVALILSLGIGMWVYRAFPLTYVASGCIKTRPGDAETLTACSEQALSSGVSVRGPETDRGLLIIWLSTSDPAAATARLDELGRDMALRFYRQPQALLATPPADREQIDALQERIGELDRRLAGLASPASQASGEGSRLVALWTQTERQRQEVESSLSQLASLPAKGPAEAASIPLDAAELQAAEGSDRKFQADTDALKQRETDLLNVLQKALEQGPGVVKALAEAVTDGQARIDKVLEEDYSPAIGESLRTLRKSLETWRQATNILSNSWDGQRERLKADDAKDLTACQQELDNAGREFVDQASTSLVAFRQALETIGHDTEQPTKGLVLGRALTKELQPAIDAQQGVVRLARSMMLSGNTDLASLVQRVVGLRRQVTERRLQIEASLRARMLENLAADRARTLKEQRDRLTRRAEELDRAIRQQTADVRSLVRRMERETGGLAERAELLRQRADAFESLAELRRQAEPVPGAGEATVVEYVPAEAELAESPHARTVRALLAGFGCLLVYLLIRIAVHGFQSWQRSRREIEAYTRELRAGAGR